jgi:Arc/MetJ-type ribon-helix-helix transcriptional regulator
MGKVKLSISVDSKTLQKIEKLIANGLFRNKSHALEYAILKLIKNES